MGRTASFIIWFILTFLSRTVLSQEKQEHKYQHIIGFEVQRTPNTSKSFGHFENYVNYNKPSSYNLLYRFNLPLEDCYVGFSSSLAYRSGFGSTKDGGNGGYIRQYGTFNVLRLNLGVSFLSGNLDDLFHCGIGLNFGKRIFSSGNIYQEGGGFSGISPTTPIMSNQVLNSTYIAFNFELNFSIKINKGKYIVIGFRQYIETPDYINSRINLTSGAFIAYNIW
jgi:hypothetical protein